MKNSGDTVVVVVEVESVAAAVAVVDIAVVVVDAVDTVDVADTGRVLTSCTRPDHRLAWGCWWAGAGVLTSDPWPSDSHWRTWRGAREGVWRP